VDRDRRFWEAGGSGGMGMRWLGLSVVVFVVALVAGAAVSRAAQPPVWNVVALGDSDTTGEGDASGLGWVGRYGRLLRQKLGFKVVVTNLAQEGRTSAELLSDVRSDATTRAAV